MKVSYKNVEYEINDRCSPFEHKDGDKLLEVDSLIPDFSSDVFDDFVSFLKHKNFKMSDALVELLSHMGYKNTNNYPLSYWKCKLQDNRFRECFESEILDKDLLFGLEDITKMIGPYRLKLLNTISKQLPKGSYLAGEFPTSLFVTSYNRNTTIVDYSNDVNFCIDYINSHHPPYNTSMDIYLTEHIDYLKLLKGFSKERSISAKLTYFEIIYKSKKLSKTIKIKRRLYSAVNEIAYSFDIDAAGLVFADGKLYATHCAKYAVTNMVNYYDEDLAEENYIERLVSFNKNFRVEVPQLDLSKINFDNLNVRYQLSHASLNLISNFTVLLLTSNYPSFNFVFYYEADDDEKIIKDKALSQGRITLPVHRKAFHLLGRYEDEFKIKNSIDEVIYGEGKGEPLPVISLNHVEGKTKGNNSFVFRVKGAIIDSRGKTLKEVPKNHCIINVP